MGGGCAAAALAHRLHSAHTSTAKSVARPQINRCVTRKSSSSVRSSLLGTWSVRFSTATNGPSGSKALSVPEADTMRDEGGELARESRGTYEIVAGAACPCAAQCLLGQL